MSPPSYSSKNEEIIRIYTMWTLRGQFSTRQLDETTGKPVTEGPLGMVCNDS